MERLSQNVYVCDKFDVFYPSANEQVIMMTASATEIPELTTSQQNARQNVTNKYI